MHCVRGALHCVRDKGGLHIVRGRVALCEGGRVALCEGGGMLLHLQLHPCIPPSSGRMILSGACRVALCEGGGLHCVRGVIAGCTVLQWFQLGTGCTV